MISFFANLLIYFRERWYDFDSDDLWIVQIPGEFDLTVGAESDSDVVVLVTFEELVSSFEHMKNEKKYEFYINCWMNSTLLEFILSFNSQSDCCL